MPTFRVARPVGHAPDRMFDLVADVERYPEFVPLCEGLRVLRRTRNGEGVETLVAEMRVGYRAIAERFTTRVTLDRPRLRIATDLVDGPFRQLENRWTFAERPGGCTVEFFITYEFRSRTLALLMGSMFDRVFRRFAEAFEARADVVYGRPSAGRTGRATGPS
jgi:coenzyme Q-binding protein COQ10